MHLGRCLTARVRGGAEIWGNRHASPPPSFGPRGSWGERENGLAPGRWFCCRKGRTGDSQGPSAPPSLSPLPLFPSLPLEQQLWVLNSLPPDSADYSCGPALGIR